MKLFQILSISSVCWLIASCSNNNQKASPVQVTPAAKAFVLQKGSLATLMSLPGQLQPFQGVDIYAKVNGFVKTMTVDVGTQVHQGQLLMTLEAPEMTAALKQAEEDLHNKEAVYRGSKSNYDRLLKTSQIPGTISPNDLDLAHARMSADSSALLAARSAYQLSADLKGYLEVRAPFDGVISARNVYTGAYVAPSDKNADKPMLTLEQHNKLRLVVNIPETATNYFADKDTIHFTVQTLPGKQFVASISRMAGSVDEKLRVEQIQMDIDNQGNILLPGMFAQVNLSLVNKQKTYIIPQSAVTENSKRVFVIQVTDGKAHWIDVQKGRENPDSLEVYGAGLKDGTVLLLNASDELKNGTEVKAAL